MIGYDIKLFLYSQTETWRQIRIPSDINFKQLHGLIQKLFGFDDYHNWEFKVPAVIPDEDAVNLNDIIKSISSSEADKVTINELFDEYDVLLYEYDFGDSWEIVVHKISQADYDNKTALILDYKGKYNPMDDMGGCMVFDEIMEAVDEDDEDLDFLLDDYGLTRSDLSGMEFEKKYKKGSKIRIK